MSLNGFQSKVWGPSAWLFLHCVTLNYEPTRHNKKGYKAFFENLKHILPCGTCRDNYSDIIRDGKLKLSYDVFESRETLSKWLFHVHNHINIRTKNQLTYSNDKEGFKQMKGFYEQFRAKCDNKKKEIGCTKSYHKGKKMRCVILLRPARTKCKSMKVCKY